jgi:hypothetical protein
MMVLWRSHRGLGEKNYSRPDRETNKDLGCQHQRGQGKPSGRNRISTFDKGTLTLLERLSSVSIMTRKVTRPMYVTSASSWDLGFSVFSVAGMPTRLMSADNPDHLFLRITLKVKIKE